MLSPTLRVFVATWLAYGGYYLCRKNFSILIPYLKTEQGYTSDSIAGAVFVYSVCYCAGQFIMGFLADRWGGRKLATLGMCVSAGVSSLTGAIGGLPILQGFNGLAQASGWPSLLKMTGDWLPATNRGTWMAWWGTNLVVGGFAATILASRFAEGGWRRAAWMPSILLVVVAIVFFFLTQDSRSDSETRPVPAPLSPLALNSTLKLIATMYFFVKMTRYSFLFWLPLYMTEGLGYSPVTAGFASSSYELIGFLGVLLAGHVSERVSHPGSRFIVGAVMMLGLAVLCVLYPYASKLGYLSNLTFIALIGAFTFGPDTLMAGAATQEASGGNTGAAGGFVNGVGSLGQIVSPYLVAVVSVHYGWPTLFALLGLASFFGALALAAEWRSSCTPLPSSALAS